MGKSLWVAADTLSGMRAPFWWRVADDGSLHILRLRPVGRGRKRKVTRQFTRAELEELRRFMADGEWHTASSTALSKGIEPPEGAIGPFLYNSLGCTKVETRYASRLGAIFTAAGLWEWNQRAKGATFRQTRADLAALDACYARCREQPSEPLPGEDQAPALHARGTPGPPPPGFSLAESFRGRAIELRGRLQAVQGGRHTQEKGHRREVALRDFLRDHLPPQYGLARGEVASYWGDLSPQIDLLIYDARMPRLLHSGDSSILPIESIYAAIEVKPNLSKHNLRKATANLRTVQTMRAGLHPASREHPPVFSAIVGCESESLGATAQAWHDLCDGEPPSHKLSCICVLDRAVFHLAPQFTGPAGWDPYAVDEHTPLVCAEAGEDSLFYFYLLLLRDLQAKTLPPLDLAPYAQGLHVPEPREL